MKPFWYAETYAGIVHITCKNKTNTFSMPFFGTGIYQFQNHINQMKNLIGD